MDFFFEQRADAEATADLTDGINYILKISSVLVVLAVPMGNNSFSDNNSQTNKKEKKYSSFFNLTLKTSKMRVSFFSFSFIS